MKRFSKTISLALAALMLFSGASVFASAESVERSFSYSGYTLDITSYDGYALIEYPDIVTEDDIEAFMAAEAAKYPAEASAVTYSIPEEGVLRLDYPEGLSVADREGFVETFGNDVLNVAAAILPPAVESVAEAEPVVVGYAYQGYELTITIEDGVAVLAYPEDAVLESDVAAFFSYELGLHPEELSEVTYSFTGAGEVTLYYPEDITVADAEAYAFVLVEDLDAYLDDLFQPVAAPAVAEVAAEPEPVVVEYDYYGNGLTVTIVEGSAVISYPRFVTERDVVEFFAYEMGLHGDELADVTYSFTGSDNVTLYYPEDITVADAEAYAYVLVDDLTVYLDQMFASSEEAYEEAAPAVEEPEVFEEDIDGMAIVVSVYSDRAEISYPSYVASADVEAFMAHEAETYGEMLSEVFYDIEEPGLLVITFPEGTDGASYVPQLLADIAAYVAPVETEDAVVYPFGVVPIVKNTQGDSEFDLFIVHTNDIHGRITEGEDGSAGYSKFSTLLKMGRSITDNILLLDAGDTFHGTNLANMFEGQTVAEIMALLGYDAMTPGNHDFNYGASRLEEIAGWAEDEGTFRVLCANITDENGFLVFQPYQVYDYNGFKVCVFGLSTPDTKTKAHPKHTVGLDFMSDEVVESAQEAIDIAHELCDFVVVLGHLGVVPDGESGITSTYVAENLDGIDLLIDGHSHTVMDGGEMVNGTLIVSTGQYMNNIGIVRVHVKDGEGEIAEAFLLPASDISNPAESDILAAYGVTAVPSDPVVDSYIEEKNAELDAILDTVVANVPMDLNGERADVRTRKTNLSKLITDAMTAESGADFTITNGGGIRASIAAGPVTLGDINNVLPFTNTITVCEITPSDIYAALEHGYSMLPEQNGAFSQTDLKIVYSTSAPAGERIKRVYLGDELLDPTDTTTLYKVATNDFMAAGGDGYTMFGRVLTEGSMLNEVFIEYLQQIYPVR